LEQIIASFVPLLTPVLDSWQCGDPCAGNWIGVSKCALMNGTSLSCVTELTLANMNLNGTISPYLGNLTALVTL
jgi:hypothetical protein